MTLTMNDDRMLAIALIRDIEKTDGSLSNVAEDDDRLLKVRSILSKEVKSDYSPSIPTVVTQDSKAKPVYSSNTRYMKTYETMLKGDLMRREACRRTGVKFNGFYGFLDRNKVYTEYYQMDLKGRKIKGRTANDVLNEAKKLGYTYRTENAVDNHDLHRHIVLTPIIFKKRTALKSR